jgi:hypothetical protein
MTGDGTLEPGDIADPELGLSDEEAGHPNQNPPADDVELGEAEALEDVGDDLAEEDD